MNKKTAWIVGILIIIVIGVGVYIAMPKNTSTTTNSSSTNNSSNQTAAATITYSDSGFSSAITVKSGDTVAIKNTSSQALQMDSDPHPTHTDDTDLNVGAVPSGQTVTFTVTKKGTFGFHNHLNPSDKGSITVN